MSSEKLLPGFVDEKKGNYIPVGQVRKLKEIINIDKNNIMNRLFIG